MGSVAVWQYVIAYNAAATKVEEGLQSVGEYEHVSEHHSYEPGVGGGGPIHIFALHAPGS